MLILLVYPGINEPAPLQVYTGIFRALSDYGCAIIPTDVETCVAKANSYKPNLALTTYGINLKYENIDAIKRICPFILWTGDDDLYFEKYLRLPFSAIATFTESKVEEYRKKNIRSFYLPWGVDTTLYYPDPDSEEYKEDIVFVGYCTDERKKFFDALEKEKINIKTFNYLENKQCIDFKTIRKIYTNAMVLNPAFIGDTNGKIAEGIPCRTFEVPACHGFQIQKNRKELPKFYEIGQETVAFDTTEEMIEKVKYYKENEEERKKIAKNGYNRTINEHSMLKRITKLFEMLVEEKVIDLQ